MKNKAFTLIELLVVIAIIALLLSIILPSLRAVKELASGAVCVSNQRQLCIAWVSYTNDNDSFLVGGSNYYQGNRATPYRWVEPPLLNDSDNPEVTAPATQAQYSLETRKNGIRAGRLFTYTGDEDLYHCPGDRSNTLPEPDAVFRSYAISGLMNGEDFKNRVGNIYTPIQTYRNAVTSPNGASQQLEVVTKITDIKSSGDKYVFVEEDVASKGQPVNAGGFVLLKSGNFDWWDWPAYYHNDTSTLGFADGHAERHRWGNPNTVKLMKGEIASDPSPNNNEDLQWLARGYLPK